MHHGDLSAYLRADEGGLGGRFLPVLVTVGALLSAAALVGVTWMTGPGRVWRVATHAHWSYLLIVPAGVAASHVGYTFAYRQVAAVRHRRRIGAGESFALVTVGFGPISPRGGFSLDARELERRGLTRRQSRCRVRVLGMLEYAVLAPATLGAAAYMMAAGRPAQAGLLPSWVIGVPLGAVVAVGLLLVYRTAGRPDGWPGFARDALEALENLLGLLRSWPRGLEAAGGMVLYWAGEIAALTACVDVFAHRRGPAAVMIVGYATGYALTRRTLPLGGAGVVEALMPFALNWVGFPLPASVVAVIVYRLLTLWGALIPAYLAWRHLRGGSSAPRPAPPRPSMELLGER